MSRPEAPVVESQMSDLSKQPQSLESAGPPEPRASSAPPSPYLTGWRLAIVIACLFFGALLIALDTNIINVAIPKISSEFHSLQDVAWYGTAYLLAITAFQPIYGFLYKYFATDNVYRASVLIFEGRMR